MIVLPTSKSGFFVPASFAQSNILRTLRPFNNPLAVGSSRISWTGAMRLREFAMSDYLPPSSDTMKQSRDPKWLREQADLIEKQGHDLAVILRERATFVEVRLEMEQKTVERNIIDDFLEGDK